MRPRAHASSGTPNPKIAGQRRHSARAVSSSLAHHHASLLRLGRLEEPIAEGLELERRLVRLADALEHAAAHAVQPHGPRRHRAQEGVVEAADEQRRQRREYGSATSMRAATARRSARVVGRRTLLAGPAHVDELIATRPRRVPRKCRRAARSRARQLARERRQRGRRLAQRRSVHEPATSSVGSGPHRPRAATRCLQPCRPQLARGRRRFAARSGTSGTASPRRSPCAARLWRT